MSRLGPATLIVIIVAILLGAAGAYGVRQHLQAPPPQPVAAAPAPPPRVYRVPIALIDLPAGRRIVASDIAAKTMTREQYLKMNLPGDASLDYRYVIGRYLKEPIPRNSPFPISKLYPEGVAPSLSDRLKPGQRAVTIAIRPIRAVGGFATPGSRVDVVFRSHSVASEDLDVPEVTFTLLPGVEVLALGESAYPGTPNKGTITSVTLAVTPEQAQVLNTVEGKGELSLAMRGLTTEPEAPAVLDRLTLEKLLGLNRKVPPPPPPAPTTFTAEIYRGGKKQTVIFTRPPAPAPEPALTPAPDVPAAPAAPPQPDAVPDPSPNATGSL